MGGCEKIYKYVLYTLTNYLSDQCKKDNYTKPRKMTDPNILKIPKNIRLRFCRENLSSKQHSADSLKRIPHVPNSHTHPPLTPTHRQKILNELFTPTTHTHRRKILNDGGELRNHVTKIDSPSCNLYKNLTYLVLSQETLRKKNRNEFESHFELS